MINKELLDHFDISKNFWEVEPQFKVANPFRDIYESDRSKKKRESSDFMWFIALCYDMGSRWRKLDIEDKHAIVGEDFCGDSDFYAKRKAELDLCIMMYCSMQDSEAEKSLREWEEGMRDRRVFLTETAYSTETYKMLEDMRKNTKALYADLARIKKDLDAEADDGRAKGGKQLSLSDTGDIDQ